MSTFAETKKKEIYSTTGFKDVIASPVFFAVLFITFSLGFFSVFGFLQNPLKLKAVVKIISNKVSVTNRLDSSTFLHNTHKDAFLSNSKQSSGHFRRISYNYDITSKQFWSDLDTSTFNKTIEDIIDLNSDTSNIGIPLKPEYYRLPNNNLLYSIKVAETLRI